MKSSLFDHNYLARRGKEPFKINKNFIKKALIITYEKIKDNFNRDCQDLKHEVNIGFETLWTDNSKIIYDTIVDIIF